MRVEYNNSIQQKIIKRNWYRVIIIGILLSLQYIIPVDADPAEARWGHASALINNGLYVYGGRTADSPNNDTSNVNELLYLDVSKSFNPAEPPWEIRNSLLVTGGQPPFLSFHSCSVGGNQNELLILFGGASREQDPEDNPLFEYNTTTGTWLNLAVTTANTPPRRSDHTIVTTSNSISYLWGGTPSEAEDTNIKALNQLYKLTTGDTISWELTTAQNSVGRWGHSATLLSDGKMYIIGGLSDGNILASMTEIPVYDTFREIWLSQTATGDTIPAQRRGHRAVGTEDNRIIIYGGTTAGRETYFDDIAVLKVVGDGLTWETHTVAGNQPPGRYDHSMTLVGSKAIVTYGLGNDFLDAGTKLFVFDIDSYTWEQTYNPSPSVMQNPSTVSNEATPTDMASMKTSSSNNNLGLIIGVSVAGGVAIIILLGLLFYYIRKRKRQPQFTSMPYEKQQASIPPIAGPAPLYNLNNFGPSSPSQGGAGGTTDNAPFIPPFASTSHQRQPSLGSLSETRNLTPVDQHDSLGSAPSNSSQSQLPQINIPYDSSYYKPFTSRPTSPLANPNPNVNYLPQTHSPNIIPTPPPSTPTPPSMSPPISPQKDIFPSNVAATGASSSTKTSSSNLRLDSDSNTAPVEFDFNLPPVAPLSFNRTRTPSPSQAQAQEQEQAQARQQLSTLQIPISTSSSSSSLPQNSSNDLVSSPIEMETTETTTTTTAEDERTDGSFNSPLFRTEALSALAGTAAAASPTDRSLSLRSVPRLNTSTPRNSIGLSSPPPTSASSRLRSSTLEGLRTHDGSATNSSRPTSPTYTNTPDDQQPRGRLFVANPDPSDESD
ncbi:uncharacterized protein OCT59_024695 [Rhizophagus irregularis]|uniref:Galactose oxidase n=2 Tax=Rhizophagus irregularis TaxID=588596 RepID=U9T8Y4_RHIID|nr:hypothetical protein GLOIN_2v1474737 [Rhizophagus irregularis DAOM 181602=DAOM 197198]EXX70283.1 Kel1p [Rhizophagus irregularis DAOM 197198w]POG76373.1 hypothetical protein GLOIN_2v1474737 [Rhizophagus irregularis DAOM 181602=DAOM 197198]UZO04306.1 hypothetical protein OCT59_024695 [Rhizophagus irregularis]GET57776.1 hypothetical protein RIR_jg41654.t1 [Rhizophagus irregularis DAOM 181602=DAOM 197198]|eukprot:XP_025183239.1 hypothetical protein GLOIN_2v1474737 [Rhizophagus irregularis DAOM 181602=DAOM 197198]